MAKRVVKRVKKTSVVKDTYLVFALHDKRSAGTDLMDDFPLADGATLEEALENTAKALDENPYDDNRVHRVGVYKREKVLKLVRRKSELVEE